MLLALVLVLSLMGGALTVSAAEDGFVKTGALEAGKEYLVVTEADGKYYALTLSGGALTATEVAVSEDTVAAADVSAVWLPDGNDHLESKGTPGQFVFASSGGLIVWDSSMLRTFTYDAASENVILHSGKYYLGFADGNFIRSEDAGAAGKILLFARGAGSAAETAAEPASAEPIVFPEPETIRRSAVKNADGSITLAFTSDVHYDGVNLNLKTWLENSGVGYIDAVGFCGDMGSAYATDAKDFWTWTGGIMDYMDSQIAAGKVGDAIYTQGNHEWFPWAGGNYLVEYANYPAAQRMMQVGEGLVTDDYIIYCFGAGRCVGESFTNDYMEEDIAELDAWLATAPTDVPIFFLTHFPLHFWYNNRYAPHAVDVIDVLNKYADDHEIIFFWGHNHSDFDDGYYKPRFPGDEIVVDPDGNTRTLNFTYLAAGCTSDADYTGPSGGSASVMNKGLIVTIKADKTLGFTYYTLDGHKMYVESPWLVRFRTGYGDYETLSYQYVDNGKTVEAPAAPELEGYTFEGWVYWDDYKEIPFDFSAPITRSYVVTAKYAKIVKPVAPAAELDPAFVYVTIQDEKATAIGKSGKPIALYPVPYVEGMTVGDAVIKVHELEYAGGLDGVATYDTTYGFWSLAKVWGHTPQNGSLIFDPTLDKCWIDANAAATPGACYYTLAYDTAWISTSAMYPARTEAEVGQTVTLCARTFAMDASYNYTAEGYNGDVYCGTDFAALADTGIDAEEGYFDIAFNAPGTYYLVVKGSVGEAVGVVVVGGGAEPAPAPAAEPAPAPAEPEPSPAPVGQTYTVKAGDTLWSIARRYYGSGFQWDVIYRANTGIIRNPGMIYVGQVLMIP